MFELFLPWAFIVATNILYGFSDYGLSEGKLIKCAKTRKRTTITKLSSIRTYSFSPG